MRRVAFRQTTLQNMKTARKRESIGIEMFPLGSLKHQDADHEMPQRQRIQLLNHSGRSFTAEVGRLGGPPRVLVRLLLVVDQFMFPAFVISTDQFHRRIKLLVQQVGQQYVLFVVARRVAGRRACTGSPAPRCRRGLSLRA